MLRKRSADPLARCRRPTRDPRQDMNVSCVVLRSSDTQFCRRGSRYCPAVDNLWDEDNRLNCAEECLPAFLVVGEKTLDVRLQDSRFDCSAGACRRGAPPEEIRFDSRRGPSVTAGSTF